MTYAGADDGICLRRYLFFGLGPRRRCCLHDSLPVMPDCGGRHPVLQ
jgi:hypothetical protein